MAKTVTRKNLKLFGKDGDSSYFGQFGSGITGTQIKTKNIDTIQALSAWLNGWQDAIVTSNKAPLLEDMNSLIYVLAYQLFYTLQEGIPEYDSSTTYFIGSRVRKAGTNEVYGSLTNDNVGNALPSAADNANWKFVYPVRFSDLVGSISLGQIPDGLITAAKIISLATTQLTGTIVNSQINDVAAGKITGQLTNSQIADLAASKLTGTLTNSQIADLATSKLTGLITNSQIQDMAASKLTGAVPLANGGTGTTFKIFTSTYYVGNGLGGSRNIAHGIGATPSLVIIAQSWAGNKVPEIWGSTFPNFNPPFGSRSMTGVTRTGSIIGADGTNVQIGGDVAVNELNVGYQMFCWRSQ